MAQWHYRAIHLDGFVIKEKPKSLCKTFFSKCAPSTSVFDWRALCINRQGKGALTKIPNRKILLSLRPTRYSLGLLSANIPTDLSLNTSPFPCRNGHNLLLPPTSRLDSLPRNPCFLVARGLTTAEIKKKRSQLCNLLFQHLSLCAQITEPTQYCWNWSGWAISKGTPDR